MTAATGKARAKKTAAAAAAAAAASKESKSEEPMKASNARSKSKGAGSRRRQQAPESGPKEGAATNAVRMAWLPHFQRLVDNPRAPVDGIVQDLLKELDKIDLASQLDDLEISNASGLTSTNTAGAPPRHDITTDALLYFLDCTVASQAESQEEIVRAFQLIAGVAARTGDLRAVLNRALTFSETVAERVRSQALLVLQQIVAVVSLPRSSPNRPSVLSEASTREQIQDENEILDAISEALTVACSDKSKLVRQSAVAACEALLALDSVEAEVLQSVVWVAQHDPVAPNRVAAIRAQRLTGETAEAIVARVRDVAPSVRVAALDKLRRLEVLDAELSAAVVQAGYTERCPETRKATEELVMAWLESLDGNVVQLLQVLDATTFEPQCETVVKILLQFASRDNSSTLSGSLLQALSDVFPSHQENETPGEGNVALSVEAIFLARVISKEDPTIFDQLDLDITQVTSLLERQIRQLKAQLVLDDDTRSATSAEYSAFVCQQLILLSSTLASSEEGAARHLRLVLEQILADPGTPDALISTAMQAMYSPLRSQGAITQDRVHETTESVLKCIEGLRNAREENASLRDFYEVRILSIWTVLLEHVPVMSAELDKLVGDVLEPVLVDALDVNVNHGTDIDSAEYAELIREAAVSCLGKLGLLLLASQTQEGVEWTNTARVQEFHRQLVAVAADASCGAEIRAQALMSLADWGIVASDMDDGFFLQALGELIPSFLDDEDAFLMCVAGEVAVKLLFAHKMLPNAKVLLARLVLLSLTADFGEGQQPSEGDGEIGSPNRLQQLMSYFFVAFATTECGRNALLGCLSTVLQLSKKNTSRIVGYVCDVARHGLPADSPESECMVDIITVQAATELATFLMNSQPSGAFLLAVCKTMSGLSLLKDEGRMPTTHMKLPTKVRRRLVSLQSTLEELGMSLDDSRALTELGRIQVSLKVFRLGSSDDESVSAHGDEDSATEDEHSVVSSTAGGTDDDESSSSSGSALTRPEVQDQQGPCTTEELSHALSLTEFFSDKENSKGSVEVVPAAITEQAPKQRQRQDTRTTSLESVFESIEAQETMSDVNSGGLSSKGKSRAGSARQRNSDPHSVTEQSSRSSRGSGRGRKKGRSVGDSLLTMLEQGE